MLADIATGTMTNETGDVYFGTGFCEREKRRAEPDLRILAKHLFCEMIQSLLEISEAHILVDVQAL